MTTATTTSTSTYFVTVPVTVYQTIQVEGAPGLTKDQVCDTITWETTHGCGHCKAEHHAFLQSLNDSRSLIDVEEETED